MRLLAFLLLALLTSPLLIAGYVLIVVVALVRVRGSGVSITALSPLSIRGILHQLGKRQDPLSEKILYSLPIMSALGLSLFIRPLRWAAGVSGYEPGLFRYPLAGRESDVSTMVNARTAFFDEIIERHRDRCAQLVLLGAGYDTRAFTHGDGLTVFEVDAPQTQALKREILERHGAQHPGTLVPVDFNETPWLEALQEHGFDAALPTIVIWEGVIYYLPRESVEAVLCTVSRLAPGSVVAFDYFGAHITDSRLARLVSGLMGEPFQFGLTTLAPANGPIHHLCRSTGIEGAGAPLHRNRAPGPLHVRRLCARCCARAGGLTPCAPRPQQTLAPAQP